LIIILEAFRRARAARAKGVLARFAANLSSSSAQSSRDLPPRKWRATRLKDATASASSSSSSSSSISCGRCVAGASTTDLKKLSSGDGDARPRGMSTRSSENDRGDDPAADGARGDDCADREPCELSLSLRGEFMGPAPELSEAARGDDWALSSSV